MENLPLQVSEALALINQSLEYAFPTLIVEGEVSSFKVNQGKFVFFDLKDEAGSLGCFMMLFQLRVPLEDGMRVQVVATPKVTAWGKFSLTAREIRPVGEGSLKRAFELLQAKLEKEGIFSEERKRPLPVLPRRIAVISSTQAAGYADFVRLLNERWGGLHVAVAHTQVQGSGAADQIIRAINYFNAQEELAEILVIIRGGGSADDLSTFNDEQLVRAIAASRIPTVVGVGHETDVTLADRAADVRAATPSHAAQIIVPDKAEVRRVARQNVLRLSLAIEAALKEVRTQSRNLVEQGYTVTVRRIEDYLEVVRQQQRMIAAYDPFAVLARGYAIVRGEVRVGEVIEIEKSKELIRAEVIDVKTT